VGPGQNRTFSMRGKEEAHDYRYFPDPDLLPVEVDTEWIDRVRSELPELPDERKRRFVEQYDREWGCPRADIEPGPGRLFRKLPPAVPQPKQVCNWVMGPLLACSTRGK
jgi:aspartyl-tRNA(Asn)/glutamyl-tRNA(Gln) amidotransferase subunit B